MIECFLIIYIEMVYVRVVVVDDYEFVCFGLKVVFIEDGYDFIIVVVSVDEFIDGFDGCEVDVIVFDLLLGDGFIVIDNVKCV